MAQVMLVLLSTMNGWGLASALIRETEVTEERLRQTLGMLILLNISEAGAGETVPRPRRWWPCGLSNPRSPICCGCNRCSIWRCRILRAAESR